jgi:hypothetical protein
VRRENNTARYVILATQNIINVWGSSGKKDGKKNREKNKNRQ